MSPTIGPDEIAEALHIAPSTFLRKWRRLNRDSGFPRPLPHSPNVWSRAQVMAWFNAGGQAAPPPAPGDEDSIVSQHRTALEARYLGKNAA
jgi:hypothetical protein